MANTNEVLRVGVPLRARKLMSLLDTLDVSDEATVRHHNGRLIVDEPDPTLMPKDGDDA